MEKMYKEGGGGRKRGADWTVGGNPILTRALRNSWIVGGEITQRRMAQKKKKSRSFLPPSQPKKQE